MSQKAALRVPAEHLAPGLLTLNEETSRYVARVHRRSVGDRVLLFDPERGSEADAEIVSADARHVVCSIAAVRPGTRRGVAGLHLVQGLGKGDKADQVVRDAVVLGAASVSLVVCERSVATSTARDETKRERLHRVAVEAARQCGRSDLPRLHFGASFGATVASAQTDGAFVVLHPESDAGALGATTAALEDVLWTLTAPRRVVLWIGPEGGFSPTEVAQLMAAGATRCSLGTLVLRTELAAVVALARAAAWLTRAAESRELEAPRTA